MPPPICNDHLFGPVVSGCSGRTFDFTRTFEDILLSLVPNTLFLITALVRIGYLVRQVRVANGLLFQLLKLGLVLWLLSLDLARVILLTTKLDGTIHQLTTARTAMTVVSAAAMIPLSFLEHTRSPRPSDLLTIFLVLTILCDIVLTRTSWLAGSQSWQIGDACIQTAAVVVKCIILAVESKSKHNCIMDHSGTEHSPEETSGLLSLAFFSWLNPLFLQGYRENLQVDSLYALDEKLKAKTMFSNLATTLNGMPFPRGFARTLAKELIGPFLLPVAPRLAMLGFTFSQPFFINALVSNIAESNSVSAVNNGYGLIGACVLIYGGIALSTSLYSYYSLRALHMLRACLVSVIYQKLLESDTNMLDNGTTVTLMSTDIERIMTGWMDIHSVWASVIEIALGCYLLHSQLGMAFLSPIIVILVCFAGMACVSAKAGNSQAAWMEKIENRVSMITTLLANIKPCKISRMASEFARILQTARDEEIQVGNHFRWLQVIAATLAYTPMCLSPVVAFAFAGQHLNVAGFFTSLSFLTLVTSPLTAIFQQIPGVIAGFTCLSRILLFLEGDIRPDRRTVFRLQDNPKPAASSSPSPALISVTNGHFGWTQTHSVLRNINANIPRGQLTVVVGPVACGKSTLCKAILGEVPFVEGEVLFTCHIPSVGYCDQTPFLSNLSIRDNIIGFSPFHPGKYQEIITATALGPDIAMLPAGHDTIVGSCGAMLSGGQKQRVSLARALYQETPLLLLDDTLTGLDQATEAEVFARVLGAEGFIRRRGTTVILFTSSRRYLSSADHIITVGKDGTIREPGHETELLEQKDELFNPEKNTETAFPASTDSNASVKQQSQNMVVKGKASQNLHVQASKVRDLDVYKHYFGTIRRAVLVTFALSCTLFGFGGNFPTVWISFWSSNSYNAPNAFYIGIYSLLSFLQLLGFFLAALMALGPMVTDAGSKLHSNALTTVIRAPLRFFTDTDTGAITSLFSQDITIIDGELPERLFNITAGLCGIIGAACVIAVASPWLALVYPVLVVIFWIVQRLYLRTSKQLRFLDLEAKGPLYANFMETTQGITTVRAFGWTTQKLEHNHYLLDQSQRPSYLLGVIQLWLLLTANLITTGIATSLTVLATQLRTDPGFTGASAVTLMTFSGLVTIFIRDYTAFETSLGAVSRLKSLSDNVKPEAREGEDLHPDEQWPKKGSIEIERLSASYDDVPLDHSSGESHPNLILKDLNLTIAPREKIAICGRTGSGKSSLVLLLLRLLDPIYSPSAKLTIDDIPIQQVDRSTLRERIIGVPQDAVFLPNGNTVKDNLDPSGLATEDECLSVLSTVNLDGLANGSHGLHTPLTTNHLSGGQKKLFGLGRAILRRIIRDRATTDTESHGGILILDEISSGVDAATERTMHEIISHQFAHYTVLEVVHGLDIVPHFFDRLIVIENGSIVKSGSPAELLQRPSSWFKQLLLMNSACDKS